MQAHATILCKYPLIISLESDESIYVCTYDSYFHSNINYIEQTIKATGRKIIGTHLVRAEYVLLLGKATGLPSWVLDVTGRTH
jgi:hypothetical protein